MTGTLGVKFRLMNIYSITHHTRCLTV